MRVLYAPTFLRMLKSLPPDLQEEAIEALDAFTGFGQHARLKIHKLKGRLAGRFAFSINYRYRIVFQYLKPDTAVMLAIGDHDVYKQ